MLHKGILLVLCMMMPATVLADTTDILASNNQIGFQSMLTDVDYTETGNGRLGTKTGILDTETGLVAGLSLYLVSMNDWLLGNDYIEVEFNYSRGNTKYTGALQNGGAYGSVVGYSGATFVNESARYGKGIVINHRMVLTPYLELAHHEWSRDVNYGEIYKHSYYGLGLLGQYSPLNRLVISLKLMMGHTYGSYITVNPGVGFDGFSGPLGNSPIYKAGVAADYAFTKNAHVNVTLEYENFNYGISGIYPIGGGFVAWEPDSSTNLIFIKFGLGYAL